MTDAAKEARAAYLKRWRAEHPEKRRANERRYWERKARRDIEEHGGELSQAAIESRAKDLYREYGREWNRKNREKRREITARYWESVAAQLADKAQEQRTE